MILQVAILLIVITIVMAIIYAYAMIRLRRTIQGNSGDVEKGKTQIQEGIGANKQTNQASNKIKIPTHTISDLVYKY